MLLAGSLRLFFRHGDEVFLVLFDGLDGETVLTGEVSQPFFKHGAVVLLIGTVDDELIAILCLCNCILEAQLTAKNYSKD